MVASTGAEHLTGWDGRGADAWLLRLVSAATLLVLVLLLPLVVRSPLTSDTAMFDLQARTVTDGGVLYRDVLEPNFPGMVWAHLAVRGIGGWSSEWMRMADLMIVATAVICLLHVAVRTRGMAEYRDAPATMPRSQRLGAIPIFLCTLFYLTRNEWCHCQRDSWMLLPVGLAMILQFQVLTGTNDRPVATSLVQGLFWGIAVWIKPHAVIMAVAVSVVEFFVSGRRWRTLRRLAIVLCGGILAGIPGVVWLISTGAWPAFVDMQLNWNPEYLAAGQARRSGYRVWLMVQRFHPWWLVHVVAVPVALASLVRTMVRRKESRQSDAAGACRVTLAVLYVAWFAQASLIQHAMDYIQVPPIFLGLVVLSSATVVVPVPLRRLSLAGFTGFALLAVPQWCHGRIQEWGRCLWGQPSWEQRDVLAQGRFPAWRELGQVVEYLERQGVHSGDVTCFTTHSIHVYSALNLLPPTRYVGPATLLELFPSRDDEILSQLANNPHRFIVTDRAEVTPQPDAWPWSLPVVFESGPLRVHAADGALHALAKPSAVR